MNTINLSDHIKVKLTPEGFKLHKKKYLMELKVDNTIYTYQKPGYKAPEVDSEGYTKFLLWDFMNIFGAYLYLGALNIIEDCLIVKDVDTQDSITFKYKNWRGEISVRTVVPIKMWFGSTEFHKEPQLLLKAIDLDKNQERDFAIADIIHEHIQ